MSLLDVIFVTFLFMLSAGGMFYVISDPVWVGTVKTRRRKRTFVDSKTSPKFDAIQELRKRDADGKSVMDHKVADEKSEKKAQLRNMLEASGLDWTPRTFIFTCLLTGLGAAAVSFVMSGNIFVMILASLSMGIIGPYSFVKWKVKKRKAKFVNQFPDALDMIVRGLKAGLPLADSIRVIANEAQEPLKSEFMRVVDMQQGGLSLDVAIDRMAERVEINEVNFFNIVIAIQTKSGGNLSEALGNLSKVIRDRRKLKEKIKALSNEAKASAMIVGSLPFIFIALLSVVAPKYMGVLFDTRPGNIALAGSVIWMGIGWAVMQKMINFDH